MSDPGPDRVSAFREAAPRRRRRRRASFRPTQAGPPVATVAPVETVDRRTWMRLAVDWFGTCLVCPRGACRRAERCAGGEGDAAPLCVARHGPLVHATIDLLMETDPDVVEPAVARFEGGIPGSRGARREPPLLALLAEAGLPLEAIRRAAAEEEDDEAFEEALILIERAWLAAAVRLRAAGA